MKKRLQLLFILLAGISYKAQDNTLAASVNTPASYQTGVPDISFPLASLPAAKDFTLGFGLAYNANAYKKGSFSGLIAKNWALTGSNFIITRDFHNGSPDETIVDTNANELYDDVYYYNLNGEQGSFKFERVGFYPNDTYRAIKLTPSNIIIEHTRGSIVGAWQPRLIESFTITDSKGYKYYFSEHDETKFYYPVSINWTTTYPSMKLRNSFYVTRVEDASGKIVATFNNVRYENDDNDTWYYLPEKITTAYGSINFEHGNSNMYNEEFPLQDSRYIQSVTLRDHKENFISKSKLDINTVTPYEFEFNKIYSRDLHQISNVDKNDVIVNEVDFSYKVYTFVPYGTSNPPVSDLGILNIVKFSSGKKIEYNFDFTKIAIDLNTPDFIQYVQNPTTFIQGINYYTSEREIIIDTKNQNRNYPLPASWFLHGPTTKIKVGFSREEWYSNGNTENPSLGGGDVPMVFEYRLVDPTVIGLEPTRDDGGTYIIKPSNNVYLQVVGTGGKGRFTVSEKTYLPPPYQSTSSGSLVLENIKFYDYNSNSETYELKKSINYDYSLFDGSGLSSGVKSRDQEDVMIYKNVKITESDKKGYTKYYFKTADDFPEYQSTNTYNYDIFPNFNLVKNGLLEKKEVYDVDNVKRQESLFDYTFPSYNEVLQYLYHSSSGEIFYTQESFFDKITTTDISYDPSGNSLTDISEKSFNQANNNLMSEKRTAADGTVSETTYQYAAEKNNTKLLGANMFSVPLEVAQKQNNMAIGKLETRYDQTGNYFPSSVKSFGINNVITGEQVNNHYDILGNVLQTTSKTGVPTAIIWGYNGTQPIAKIEGAEYFNVLSLMGEPNVNLLDIVQRSNQDISSTDNTNEQLLRDALEAFRKKPEFKNYLITTYTYDPLIGVKSMTTPNGFTEYYYYDNQNRPTRVEDGDHHIIRENRYQQNVFQNAN